MSTPERIREIAHDLAGTAKNLRDVLTDEEADNLDLVSEIYEFVFECDCCGWWCSVDELNNEGDQDLCDDCHDEWREI